MRQPCAASSRLVRALQYVHPHKALGYRSPRESRVQMSDTATENAVAAWRRPHDSTMSTEAIRSSPPAARSAKTQSL